MPSSQKVDITCRTIEAAYWLWLGCWSNDVENPQNSALSSPTPAPTHTEWPSQEEPGSGLSASAPVSGVSAPGCANGVWLSLRPVSVTQKNKASTMSSSNVQSIDLPMDCTAWRFWMMRQLNGSSTYAPRSSAAKQWIVTTGSNDEEAECLVNTVIESVVVGK